MISFITRRIAGRVIRRLTGEDREPVSSVSDRDFELAGYALTFAAGACSMAVAVMFVVSFYWSSICN